MHRHRFIRLLLLPSLFSSVIGALLAVGILVSVNLSLILNNLPFYNYFFGIEGAVTNLQGPTNEAVVTGEVTDSRALVVLSSVLLISLVLLVAVRGITGMISSIFWTVQEMRAVDGPAKRAVERELGRRIGVRFLIAFVWAAYIFVSVKVVLPFGILASQLGFSSNSSVSEGIGYVFFALALFFVSLHLHVIMARLFALRPRVFGGEEALLVS